MQSTYGTSGNTVLSFSSLTRAVGATGNLVTSGGLNGVSNKVVVTGAAANALIDPGIYFGGSSYAWNDAGGFVRAVNYGVDSGTATSAATTSVNSVPQLQITGAISADVPGIAGAR